MEQNNELKLFEDKKIRAKWNDEQEKWYFSVVDIVSALTDNDYQAGRKYWKTLKMRLNKEGSELVTNCYQLKMEAYDGKLRDTDVMTTEQILRLIQSIPSKKAEPFKLWLAQVGKERIDEAYDPEIVKSKNCKGFNEAEGSVIKGGNIARIAKEQLERETGKKIVSNKNAKEIRKLNSGEKQ